MPLYSSHVVGSPEADDANLPARAVASVLQDIGMEADDARAPSPEDRSLKCHEAAKGGLMRVHWSQRKHVNLSVLESSVASVMI